MVRDCTVTLIAMGAALQFMRRSTACTDLVWVIQFRIAIHDDFDFLLQT